MGKISNKMMGRVAYLANFFLLTMGEDHCGHGFQDQKISYQSYNNHNHVARPNFQV